MPYSVKFIDQVVKFVFEIQTIKILIIVILLEEAPYQEGLHHLELLMWAIVNKQPHKILYNAFGKENKEHLFHPYFLKQYKQRWYLIGGAKSKPFIYPLALDRIRKVEEFVVEYKS